MTDFLTEIIECPKCHHPIAIKHITCANVTLYPEFKKIILDDSLFQFSCNNCLYTVKKIYPMLYHDMTRNLLIFLLPENFYERPLKIDSIKIPNEFKSTCKRIVKTPFDLKEEIAIFEEGLCDSIVWAIKFALSEATSCKVTFINTSDDCLIFKFSNSISENSKSIKKSVYSRLLDIYSKKALKRNNNFETIDSNWIKNTIQKITSSDREDIFVV